MNTSFKTSIFGYIIIFLDIANLIGEAVKQHGLPSDVQGWIIFAGGLATGIGLILAKDFNVTNSPQPVQPNATILEKLPIKDPATIPGAVQP